MNYSSSSSSSSSQHQGLSKSFYDFPAFSTPLIESTSPYTASMPTLDQYVSGESSISSNESSTPTTDQRNSVISTISSDEEAKRTTQLSRAKLLSSPEAKISQNVAQNQCHLYEDIWMDSPIFEEYLVTLESWLVQYLTWIENAQQCRQLETAYNKAISLLHLQTKNVLDQPFYNLEECNKSNWINRDKDSEYGNEKIDIILAIMINHGKKIQTAFKHNRSTILASRAKLIELSNIYCATQKSKVSQNYLDEITSNLHRAKKNLSKKSAGYVQKLFSLIQSTRDLLNQELISFLKNLENNKNKNLGTLEELIKNSIKFMSAVDANSYILDQESNSEQLSRYISQKSASYYRFLNATNSHRYVSTESNDFPFSNTPKITSSLMYQMDIRGYLLIKQKSPKTPTNNSTGKWDRQFLYISGKNGHLKQHKNQNTSVTLVNLNDADIQALESEKRSYIIQVSVAKDDICFLLQSETFRDYSQWLHSLSSWSNKKAVQQNFETSSKSSSMKGNRFLTKRSIIFESSSTVESLSISSCKNNAGTKLVDIELDLSLTECANYSLSYSDYGFKPTQVFKIYKSCYSKIDCDFLHSGELWDVDIKLDKHKNIYIQAKNKVGEPAKKCIELVSLEPSNIYSVIDSSHSAENCIAIRPSSREIYHFLVDDEQLREIWLAKLKSYCLQFSSYRKTKCLTIRLGESRKIQTKDSLLYCNMLLDQEIRGSTGLLKKTPNISWGKDFVLTDISPIDNGITINMYSKDSKADRSNLYGSIFVSTEQILLSSSCKESWYEIKKETSRHRTFASFAGLGSGYTYLGEVRIGILWEEHGILPLDAYCSLINILKDFNHELTYDLVKKTSDIQSLAGNLLNIYEGLNLTLPWIKSLIDYEVGSFNLDDANILFRGNSFFTKVIDCYMKMNGKQFLKKALKSNVKKICEENLCIEMDSFWLSNLSEESKNSSNLELFKQVEMLWDSIQEAKEDFPHSFHAMFEHLKSAVVKKFCSDKKVLEKQYEAAKYICVSGFVFLRWICPAIISPKQFGLVQDYPDINTGRTLTLLAKCLIALANHSASDHSSKDSWSEQSKTFIKNNTDKFVEFIDYISVTQEGICKNNNTNQKYAAVGQYIDLPYELARLTQRCSENHHSGNAIAHICHSIQQTMNTVVSSE